MNPEQTLLIFAEPRVGQAFGLALCAGLAIVVGAFLLRPWPPAGRRVLIYLPVLALCTAAAASLLQQREVQIDLARSEVRESGSVLGWGRDRTWPLAEVRAVVVERDRQRAHATGPRADPAATQVRFHVGLQTADEWIELRAHADVLVAEAQALQIAEQSRWTALRRGYQLETSTVAGETGRFQTGDGRQGATLELKPVARVIVAPDQESPIGD